MEEFYFSRKYYHYRSGKRFVSIVCELSGVRSDRNTDRKGCQINKENEKDFRNKMMN